MNNTKKISPLVMGALTLTMGMSLVNNANATLIAGSGDGATVTTAEIYVNAEDNFGEDSAFINLGTGDDSFGIYVDAYSYTEQTYSESAGYLSGWWDQLQFSVNSCSEEDFGEEGFGVGNCLNKLDVNTEINADWFNGNSGYGSSFGILYEDEFEANGTLASSIGNWDSIGATGYVAFRFLSDYSFEDEELFFGEFGFEESDIWQQNNVQYGWLEVTRGSITINSFAVQNITSVPEPGSLLLLGAGLFGLAARKKAKRTEK